MQQPDPDPPGGDAPFAAVPPPGAPAAAAGRSGAPPAPAAGASGVEGVPAGLARVLGPLAPHVLDRAATDVFLNPDGAVWVDRGAGVLAVPGLRIPPDAARRLAVELVSAGGRHIDELAPCVDVRLGGGLRVHAALPPVARGGPAISIRIPGRVRPTLDDLDALGLFAPDDLARVQEIVAARRNALISGAGGSGKTTLLGAMLSAAPAGERIVLIEDVAELRPEHDHVVALEARQANTEGAGLVPLERLVREALRMRPDRLVLGECRGAELRELLAALNTGHDGGAGTIHANSLEDVPARLEALGALAGLDPLALARQVASAIDVVLHLERRAGTRRLAAIGRLELDGGGRLRAVAA
ncbi:TadA family conjugal transfer-associated ATPase [Homoserinibacter sp. YIM 151385]|uniref:TadA family conjugal transfer-associated ATPase n=1 Tax=Homoserinibacter sp. YIM 151385 TaxID=2985506 RepID=UPI0022F0C757|nr:TadA family conjugal transfer-associated ATPase [Homoserinibacter sp. YIM 151385]WBU36868.1 TadA family conjugal transfer-associated ATPase [Homoserinibacter sp. YIM 151385]